MILVTVPHSVCLEDEKMCDTGAIIAAKAIIKNLSTPSELLLSEQNRTERDDNRPWGKETAFQRNLMAFLRSGKTDLVIDVHSFPRGAFKENNGVKLVVLDPLSHFDDTAKNLYKYLEKSGLAVQYIEGSQVNYIVTQSRKFKIKAVLLEFRRDLSRKTVNLYSEYIAKFFS